MANTETIRVEGLSQLQRGLRGISKDLGKELRSELAAAGEPVRLAAQQKAVDGIRNIGDRWSQMRIGVTNTGVYIAPKTRSRRDVRRPRPNLAGLLVQRAMLPAAREGRPEVISHVEHLLDRLETRHGF